MKRNRPYGKPFHTDSGVLRSGEVKGLTLRDIQDCLMRAFVLSHPSYHDASKQFAPIEPNCTLIEEAMNGEAAKLDIKDLLTLVGGVDPEVLADNLSHEIESAMGFFPDGPCLVYLSKEVV